jgi:hypothetical protein
MNKAVQLLVLGLTGVLSILACSGKESQPLVAQDYRSWKNTHTIELNYPIPGHEDKYRRIYINPEGEKSEITTANGRISYRYPEGTQVIKEIYEAGTFKNLGKPSSLTVMIKRKDHPKARAGWLWILKDTASGSENIIQEEFCVTCHANANEKHPYGDRNPNDEFRDYLFFPFPDPGINKEAVPLVR